MGWIVRLDLPESERDQASSLLWDLSTTGIAELDGARPTVGVGARRVLLLAGFDQEREAVAAVEALTAAAAARSGDRADWRAWLEAVDEGNWIDPERSVEVEVARTRLVLEVGAAFGHGAHPTTELALRLLEEVHHTATLGAVLDFGTGTGVLALAAACLGATSVLAVDNDPTALAVAERNRDRHPDLARRCPIELAAAIDPVTEGRFDVIVANVLLPVHRDHAPALVRARRPDGWVLVSGVLSQQRNDVEHAYRPLLVDHTVESGDWTGLALR